MAKDKEKKNSILGDTYIKKGSDEIVIRAGLKLFIAWIVFAVLVGVYVYVFFLKTDKTVAAGNTDNQKASFELTVDESVLKECDNQEINKLIRGYLDARIACDQEKLKELVTTPEEFDDMTSVKSASEYTESYEGTKCYIADGKNDTEYILIVVSQIHIKNVKSTPLDVMNFYIVEKDGNYLIDNSKLSDDTTAFINTFIAQEKVQELYIQVKDDIDKCLKEDTTFSDFYNTIHMQQ